MDSGAEALRWAKIAVLVGLVLGTYGLVLNDEQDQASALHNLANGSLLVVEHPDQFYQAGEGFHQSIRFPGVQPVGSTLLNYLAIPVLFTLKAADQIVPLGIWTAAAVVLLAWSLIPAMHRTPVKRWMAGAGFVALASGFRFQEVDLDSFGAVVALQATNLLLLGVSAFFLFLAIRRHAPGAGTSLALAAVLIGPLMFWGWRLKYSMLAATLVCIALWLVGEAPSLRRNLALGLVAALAIWNNIGEGVVLLGAGGIWLLVETVRSRPRPAWRQWLAAPAIGLAIGVAPWMLENMMLRGNPFAATYLVPVDGSPSQASGFRHFLALAIGGDVWAGPVDFVYNLAGQWTTGWRVEGNPLGVFAISPLLALGLFTMVRTRWWRRSDLLLAVLILLLHLVLLTNRAARQGWGFDARLLLPVLPAIGLLAASALSRALGEVTARSYRMTRTWALAWACAGTAFFLLAGLTFDQGLRDWGVDRTLFWIWGLFSGAVILLVLTMRGAGWLALPSGSKSVALGILLSTPMLWMLLVALTAASAAPSVEGQTVSALVPLADDIRGWLGPRLFPPGPLPIVSDQYGVVFHPEFGYCDTAPSPCPSGFRGNLTVG